MKTSANKGAAPLKRPDRVISYFSMQKGCLALLTLTGLIYNIGLAAGPWFEGQLAQCLLEITRAERQFSDMLTLAAAYVAVIAAVQGSRFFKRLLVRKFSNRINRCMKQVFYANLIQKSGRELAEDGVGNMMAKAVGDVDACSEGIRKFTTEIFDTGVALLVYLIMLLRIDWRLALLCMIFPPISYVLAERMKLVISRTSAASRACAGRLSAATLDRVSGAVTYRIFGCEPQRDAAYEELLTEYERCAVRAGIPAAAMQPLYQAISMGSAFFILYFGSRNVIGTGWTAWDIAALTTFLSCYTKLSVKSSHAAKLFNAVQKARVSWNRIHRYLAPPAVRVKTAIQKPAPLRAENLTLSYPNRAPFFTGLSFQAESGQLIGVTGPVACGKSSFGKLFLGELPYEGSVTFSGTELNTLPEGSLSGITGYIGHDPELLNDTVRNNVLLGADGDVWTCLRAVCLDEEIRSMPQGIDTLVGDGGVRLSGGQKQRLALARLLAHPHPLYVLDDPFSALDQKTEEQVFANLHRMTAGSTVLLISHRLTLFPQLDGVLWIADGQARFADHERLLVDEPLYRELYQTQEKGGNEK